MIPDKPKVLEQAKQIDARPGSADARYKLADLLTQCSPNASVPKDSIAWNMMGSVGKEIEET